MRPAAPCAVWWWCRLETTGMLKENESGSEHTTPAEGHLPPDPISVVFFHLLIYNCTTPLLKSSALVQDVHKNTGSRFRNKKEQRTKNQKINKLIKKINKFKKNKKRCCSVGEETDISAPLVWLKSIFFCQQCQATACTTTDFLK